MDIAAAELLEDAQPLHRPRDEERLSDVLCEVDVCAAQDRVEQFLRIDDAAEVVEIFIGDGEHVVRRLADDAQLLGLRFCEIDPRDLRARRHER